MTINERCTDVPTAQEAVFLARLDYALHKGNPIRVSFLSNGERDWDGDFVVLLDMDMDMEDIEGGWRWNDEYLDPYWGVTPVNDAAKAALEESRASSDYEGVWTYGPSYRALEEIKFPNRH